MFSHDVDTTSIVEKNEGIMRKCLHLFCHTFFLECNVPKRCNQVAKMTVWVKCVVLSQMYNWTYQV